MNARQIFEALLAGRKVGESDQFYVYLNVDGVLMGNQDDPRYPAEEPDNMLASIIYYGNAKCLPEEGE
jgi:hypothetical protein